MSFAARPTLADERNASIMNLNARRLCVELLVVPGVDAASAERVPTPSAFA